MRLFIIAFIYYFLFIAIPFLVYSFYLRSSKRNYLLAGINPFWFSLFQSVSLFTNCGISLLSDGLVPFATDYVINLFSAAQVQKKYKIYINNTYNFRR